MTTKETGSSFQDEVENLMKTMGVTRFCAVAILLDGKHFFPNVSIDVYNDEVFRFAIFYSQLIHTDYYVRLSKESPTFSES